MKTSFTPGPWIHELDDGANIRCTDGYAICDMAYEYSSIPRDELEANARLITAAPELLEALNATLAVFRANGDNFGKAAQLKARAAIAKATGAAA